MKHANTAIELYRFRQVMSIISPSYPPAALLPDDVFIHIFEHLHPLDLLNTIARTCRWMHCWVHNSFPWRLCFAKYQRTHGWRIRKGESWQTMVLRNAVYEDRLFNTGLPDMNNDALYKAFGRNVPTDPKLLARKLLRKSVCSFLTSWLTCFRCNLNSALSLLLASDRVIVKLV